MTFTWSITKTHLNNANDNKKNKMERKKKMKMPTRNDKMTTNNDKVSKKHNGNIRCARLDMQYIFLNKTRHQDVEGWSLKGARYDVEGGRGQKCIGNITKALYFFELRSLGSMVGRTIGDIGKAPKSCFYTIRGANKNKIMGA